MIIIYAALVAICTYLMCRLLNMRKTSFQLVAQKIRERTLYDRNKNLTKHITKENRTN